MKNTFSQAMAWLHTWAGLIIGWLLFVIFVGGTLACFDKEIGDWMRPALHDAPRAELSFAPAIALAQRDAKPHAHALYVTAPTQRERATSAYVYYDDGSYDERALNPATGERLPDTAGGDFFFTLHYNLHAGTIGMYLVGVAGMFMLVAILTGIVIHKRVFKDFFTFRPKTGGQRAWLDGHNLTGVLGLPFHLMIAYTGVAIFVASYMFAGVQVAYDSDAEKFFAEAGDSYERPETGKPLPRLYPVDSLIADATRRLGVPPTWVNVHHPDDSSATIAFGGDHSRHVAWNFDQVVYDANDGKLLHVSKPSATGYKVYTFLGGLHMAQWGGSALRWLYFCMGLAGCVMLASGMQVWVNKRARKVAEAGAVSGYGLVQSLNLGVVGGMPLGCVAMLIANRVLPAGLAERASWEIGAFCAAWIAAALYALIPSVRRRGWGRYFGLNAIALAALPLVNLATAPKSHLFATLARGDWALAAVDLTALGLALAFALLALRARKAARGAVTEPARLRGGERQAALAER